MPAACPPRPYRAIECEAVGQAALERMLRKVLDGLLPESLERVVVREQHQRKRVAALLRTQVRVFHRRQRRHNITIR